MQITPREKKKSIVVCDRSGKVVPGGRLLRAIRDANLSEETLRSLPAQTIYIACKAFDIASVGHVLEVITTEQYSTLLDFELWDGDSVSEERFWYWLETINDLDDGLEHLSRFISSIDLHVLALIIFRFVECIVVEERTDQPPGPAYYTPDQGHTWLRLRLEDPGLVRLLGKLLALLHTTNPGLFYNLVINPNQMTPLELEEEAYAIKTRRLSDVGIPDYDIAAKLHAACSAQAIAARKKVPEDLDAPGVQPVLPLVYQQGSIEPLDSLFRELAASGTEELDGAIEELTLITNAAIIFYHVPFYEAEQVSELIGKVRGSINIGLQRLCELTDLTVQEVFREVRLQNAYKVGLFEIRELQRKASSIPQAVLDAAIEDQLSVDVVSYAREDFPELPRCIGPRGELVHENGVILGGKRPFETMSDISLVHELINSRFSM